MPQAALAVVTRQRKNQKPARRPATLPRRLPGLGGGRDGIVVGSIVRLDADGVPLVTWTAHAPSLAVRALTTIHVGSAQVGRRVVLVFEDGDSAKPIIMGLIQEAGRTPPFKIEVDGERLLIAAEQQIVLQCGEASLTLTRAGKVLIHGKYLLSRSSGANCIKGGSVHIN